MAIEINGKIYRNLQEQVQKNMEDIEELQEQLDDGYYTKTQINSALSDKADKSDTYTKTEVNSALALKADRSDTYTKTEVNSAINDLRWELGSHTLDVDSDTDVAFSKSVPNYTIGCQINQVGGMSYKVNQLVKNGNFADTSNWNAASSINIAASNNILTGTYNTNFEAYAEEVKQPITITAGHKFLVSVNLKSLTMSGFYIRTTSGILGQTSSIGLYSNIVTVQNNGNYIGFGGYGNIEQGTGYSISNLNLFDLTADFGSGNEPSTVEACASAYLHRGINIYSYTPQQNSIRDTAVTSVVSKDSNNTTLDTLSIPTAIQNITGYGWGVNDTCYNYIDYEAKKFVKKVGRIDLGTLNWSKDGDNRFYNRYGNDLKIINNGATIGNILCPKYDTVAFNDINTRTKEGIASIISDGIASIFVYDTAYNDTTAFKTAMSGVYLYYELAEPIETGISEYLDDNSIEVEPLGTLTFNNTYEQAVPSDIDYLIEEVKA